MPNPDQHAVSECRIAVGSHPPRHLSSGGLHSIRLILPLVAALFFLSSLPLSSNAPKPLQNQGPRRLSQPAETATLLLYVLSYYEVLCAAVQCVVLVYAMPLCESCGTGFGYAAAPYAVLAWDVLLRDVRYPGTDIGMLLPGKEDVKEVSFRSRRCPLLPYAPAMRCPVLLCAVRYWGERMALSAHLRARRCPILPYAGCYLPTRVLHAGRY
eukprot:3829982-Rhodomonas_salina.1